MDTHLAAIALAYSLRLALHQEPVDPELERMSIHKAATHVSGVVLANASLDIAFHDTVLRILFDKVHPGLDSVVAVSSLAFSTALNTKEGDASCSASVGPHNDESSYNDYLKLFWVGLMDGDGSIQVNHFRKNYLQYRLVINLANLKSNYDMLRNIAKVVGGTVRIAGTGDKVI